MQFKLVEHDQQYYILTENKSLFCDFEKMIFLNKKFPGEIKEF